MSRQKLFTQVSEISEINAKRFEEIAFFLFIKNIQKVENADILLEGIATAAQCKPGIILHATELFYNEYYRPKNIEISTFISYYNIPIRNIKVFDISERTYYRLVPEFLYKSTSERDELVKNLFNEEIYNEVVKFNKMLYNLTSPFKIYDIMKER